MSKDIEKVTQKPQEQKRYGVILPYSQKSEFPRIRQKLRRRDVEWYERKITKTTGHCSFVIFWVFESELSKLPVDNSSSNDGNTTKQYFEVSMADGHGIGRIEGTLNMFKEVDGVVTGPDIKHPIESPCMKKKGK